LIIVKSPYQQSTMSFQTELGFSAAEYTATHYELISGAGNEFERYSNIDIKFQSVFARFGVRFAARSNVFNPYAAGGIQLGATIDRGSLVTGTYRINSQTNDVSEPVPLPGSNGVWLSIGGKKQFTDRMSLAIDIPVSQGLGLTQITPRIILLF
jgi:hypothetical protein